MIRTAKALPKLIALVLIVFARPFAFAGDVQVFSGARFDQKKWQSLQTFDVRTLSQDGMLLGHVGQLVEIHFHFRSKDVRHLRPNWFQSALWQTSPEGRRGFVSVPVMVAKGDVEAFKKFTTDPRAALDLKVYGQVLHDLEVNYVFVKLLGTMMFTDSDNSVNVSW